MTKNPPKINLDLRSISQEIGRTPLLHISSLSSSKVQVHAKAEWYQLGNSVKARAAYHIILEALSHRTTQGRTLIDASSGNTAIAYASICSRLNIPLAICLPANASQKRKDILRALGVDLRLTSELEGTDGAQAVAKQLVTQQPDKYYLLDQYSNEANWKAHYQTTANEIWTQSKGKISHFVTGLGTTGSMMGNAIRLKELNPEIKAIGLQPDSPMHILEGWKHLDTAAVPSIYNDRHIDSFEEIDSMEVLDMIKFIAKHEGLLISPSSAANLIGAKRVADQTEEGFIGTLLPDDISKYSEILNMIN
ncbi:MAG: cysteine synthase family protein [Flavobacteriales bacterium]|nr:cysteine synthase family protein [Flavobacteriales bacterium]NNK80655.1 cysteine synthase family protein [Flavobacteriales bacterium]